MKSFLVISLITIANFCFSQSSFEKICGKKWYPDIFKDSNGKNVSIDLETRQLYTLFNCDGTFESMEDLHLLVRGTWIYNEKPQTITLLSNDTKDAKDTIITILSCDGKMLEFLKIDAGGDKIFIYSIAK